MRVRLTRTPSPRSRVPAVEPPSVIAALALTDRFPLPLHPTTARAIAATVTGSFLALMWHSFRLGMDRGLAAGSTSLLNAPATRDHAEGHAIRRVSRPGQGLTDAYAPAVGITVDEHAAER